MAADVAVAVSVGPYTPVAAGGTVVLAFVATSATCGSTTLPCPLGTLAPGQTVTYTVTATVAGLSEHLWKLEQPAHAVANGYYMGCINRVGTEAPWNIGKFYGSSYIVNPRGKIIAQASEDKDEAAELANAAVNEFQLRNEAKALEDQNHRFPEDRHRRARSLRVARFSMGPTSARCDPL